MENMAFEIIIFSDFNSMVTVGCASNLGLLQLMRLEGGNVVRGGGEWGGVGHALMPCNISRRE